MVNETNRENLIDLTNDYDVRSLNSDTVNTACSTPSPGFPNGNQQPCYIAAYKIFQVSGAPSIATTASSAANRSPLFNRSNAFQGPRQVRFGFRFLF